MAKTLKTTEKYFSKFLKAKFSPQHYSPATSPPGILWLVVPSSVQWRKSADVGGGAQCELVVKICKVGNAIIRHIQPCICMDRRNHLSCALLAHPLPNNECRPEMPKHGKRWFKLAREFDQLKETKPDTTNIRCEDNIRASDIGSGFFFGLLGHFETPEGGSPGWAGTHPPGSQI